MDLNKELKIASDKIIEEKLPGMVEKKVENMLNEILDDTFRSYGDVAKSIKEKIQEKINVNLQEYDMVDYNALIAQTINRSLVSSVNEECIKPIEKMIEGVVGFVDKKEISISEIADMVIEAAKEDNYGDDEGEISFHIDENIEHKWHRISFDFEADKSPRECSHEFLVNGRGGIFIFRCRTNWESKGEITPRRMINLRDIESKIFRLYSAQVKIVFDRYSVELGWSKYEY